MVTDLMIQAEGLKKRYGDTQALAGVSFDVPAGTILGLLGPNGAGKTTAVRVLTTLAMPDAGPGHGGRDRRGEAPERGAAPHRRGRPGRDMDGLLTGRENLTLVGELCDMGRGAAKARAAELLEQFELTQAADRLLKGYSGGMRRRLDLAAVADDQAAGAVPRRADHGAGPHVAPAGMGRHPRPCWTRA